MRLENSESSEIFSVIPLTSHGEVVEFLVLGGPNNIRTSIFLADLSDFQSSKLIELEKESLI